MNFLLRNKVTTSSSQLTLEPSDLLFKIHLQCFFQKQLPEGTGYKDESGDRGDKRRKERVLTFKCRATKRPGAILRESKSITFLVGIRVVTLNACWYSAKRQRLPEEWPSQDVWVKSRASRENTLQTQVLVHHRNTSSKRKHTTNDQHFAGSWGFWPAYKSVPSLVSSSPSIFGIFFFPPRGKLIAVWIGG